VNAEGNIENKRRRPSWRFVIVWTIALIGVFGTSAELVMARGH